MTYEQLKKHMERQRERYGTWLGWAKAIGVSPAYISDVWLGRRDPGAKLLDAMGLERVVEYRPKKKEEQ